MRWRRGRGSGAATVKVGAAFPSVNEDATMKFAHYHKTGEGGGKLDIDLSKCVYLYLIVFTLISKPLRHVGI